MVTTIYHRWRAWRDAVLAERRAEDRRQLFAVVDVRTWRERRAEHEARRVAAEKPPR